MDVLQKLKQIMNEKHVSEYKLAKLSNVPQSTINSMFRKYNNPSIYTLESICKALDITMSDFFYEEDMPKTIQDDNLHLLVEQWNKLSVRQKQSLVNFLTTLNE